MTSQEMRALEGRVREMSDCQLARALKNLRDQPRNTYSEVARMNLHYRMVDEMDRRAVEAASEEV